ncbi:hypothetical protein [Paenibacillus sp. XY044]|uniref:hypothetical protein n=1 Tax=Paenibacillus sp. XY044 TaxID=2026089 RepID=UPI000B98D65F|nr:hypothetical protein [Paenibacillus sp. XY044]OZB92173.1 hypothetical protein CJP46_24865 [Paenibacillus sp. XY044]
MKIAKKILAITILSFTVACAMNSNNVPDPANDLHTRVKLNYDVTSVEDVMKVKGIKFLTQPSQHDWVLAGEEPHEYAVGSTREQTAPQEDASVYIFESEQQRKKGIADFHKQIEKYNMLYPRIYEKRNVLILYWATGDMNKPAKLGDNFTNAMNSLRIVTEFKSTSLGDKEVPYTIRIGEGTFGGIAFTKGTAISSIDTHMNGRVHTLQIRNWRLPSAITIEYKANNIEVKYTESSSSKRENVLISFRDDELDPTQIKVFLNGRKERVVGIEQGIE